MSNPAKRERVALSFSDKIKLIKEHEGQPLTLYALAISSGLGCLHFHVQANYKGHSTKF